MLDRLEKLDGRERRVVAAKEAAAAALSEAQREVRTWEEAQESLDASAEKHRAGVASGPRTGSARTALTAQLERYATVEHLRVKAGEACRQHRDEVDAAGASLRASEEKLGRIAEERAALARRREIFTVDVELDEVMTAFKLTFMNLCCVLMRQHLGTWMELETLIETVLTLPGERAVTATTETVRIYRPARDAKTMAAVERACATLTARGLVRDRRALRFELVDGPAPPTRPRPRSPGDPVDPRNTS
ncbi:MAG: hypothetical protein JXX28_16540 [Deltaproteobacteria bacterium]|nr:hypothetical protein [Deltaproteobacteria bacterium]